MDIATLWEQLDRVDEGLAVTQTKEGLQALNARRRQITREIYAKTKENKEAP